MQQQARSRVTPGTVAQQGFTQFSQLFQSGVMQMSNSTHSIDPQLLARRIADFQVQLATMAPAEVLTALGNEIEAMVREKLGAGALRPGARVPAFSLANATGKETSLTAVLAKGPAVITFYRGAWCPYCDLQLRAYQEVLEQIQGMGATLIAISPQTPDQSLTTAEKAALEFPVLSDTNNKVASSFGLVFKVAEGMANLLRAFGIDLQAFNGSDSWELPVSATFIVAPDHTVAYAYVEADYRKRLEPGQLLQELAKVATLRPAKIA
jgi:peroxiredoxin